MSLLPKSKLNVRNLGKLLLSQIRLIQLGKSQDFHEHNIGMFTHRRETKGDCLSFILCRLTYALVVQLREDKLS